MILSTKERKDLVSQIAIAAINVVPVESGIGKTCKLPSQEFAVNTVSFVSGHVVAVCCFLKFEFLLGTMKKTIVTPVMSIVVRRSIGFALVFHVSTTQTREEEITSPDNIMAIWPVDLFFASPCHILCSLYTEGFGSKSTNQNFFWKRNFCLFASLSTIWVFLYR